MLIPYRTMILLDRFVQLALNEAANAAHASECRSHLAVVIRRVPGIKDALLREVNCLHVDQRSIIEPAIMACY